MTQYCYEHRASMFEKFSKTKVDEFGKPKPYWSHVGPDGQLCFGKGKAPVGDHTEVVEEIKEKEKTEADDYRMDTRREKAFKGFEKVLGIITSNVRGLDLRPFEAFKDDGLYEWLYVFCGDEDFFNDWLETLKTRVEKIKAKNRKEMNNETDI